MKALIVLSTAPSRREAAAIAKTVVKEKLAACVSIVPGLYSRYWWQGKVDEAHETLLILKTLPRLYPRLEKRIQQLHSYTVPEILALPISKGLSAYVQWMQKSLR